MPLTLISGSILVNIKVAKFSNNISALTINLIIFITFAINVHVIQISKNYFSCLISVSHLDLISVNQAIDASVHIHHLEFQDS